LSVDAGIPTRAEKPRLTIGWSWSLTSFMVGTDGL
jgi:hypothetical protein